MSAISYIFIFLLGLIIGSFLNCVIYRMEVGEGFLKGRPRRKASFLRGRSYCPHCEHALSWKDLIPILSFIWLRGHCRYCKEKISWQYPLVEIATGLLFVFNFLRSDSLPAAGRLPDMGEVGHLFIIPFLIIIFVFDLKHYIIPDKVVFPAIAIALILGFTKSPLILEDFVNPLASALGAAAFFLAIVLISRGKWMGVGDIKLAFLMGLILGWPNILLALFLAFFIGAIIGVGLIILGEKTIKSEVPFGPFLVGGTFVALFWGKELINWYAKILYFN